MNNNFRTIYLYVVSFITLCMIVGGIVSTTNNITTYIFPDSYIFFDEDDYTDNSIRRQNYKNEKIKDTVVSVVVIAVGAVMYKYHWNAIEKERTK